MSDIQRDREERQHVIEVLKSWDGYFIGYTSDEVQEALSYAIASIKTDLKYDLLYEETSGQADKPTTKNDIALIHTEGLDEEIRCAMCTNSIKSDRGCDGGCVVNNAMYKEVMDVIENHIVDTDKMVEPTTKNDLGVDCISRADVLKLMQDNWHTHNGDWAMQESMDDIRALPAVTPQEPRWISVSERLPEDRREVLVTAYWHETYQVMMASYYGDGLWWCVPFNNCGEHMQRLKPKAWMPLPHKAESEG